MYLWVRCPTVHWKSTLVNILWKRGLPFRRSCPERPRGRTRGCHSHFYRPRGMVSWTSVTLRLKTHSESEFRERPVRVISVSSQGLRPNTSPIIYHGWHIWNGLVPSTTCMITSHSSAVFRTVAGGAVWGIESRCRVRGQAIMLQEPQWGMFNFTTEQADVCPVKSSESTERMW